MKAINLFTFTRIQQDYATEYENLLSGRAKKEKVRAYEFETLVKFDKTMLVIDNNFRYGEDGNMQEQRHPNPDYRFSKLLYQGVSRAREKLCILVVENYTIFQQISNIKYHMLERYQYKENTVNNAVSGKKLNKMVKSIRDCLSEVDSDDAETIKDTVMMINDELLADEPKKRVVCNGIKLLTMMLAKKEDFVPVHT